MATATAEERAVVRGGGSSGLKNYKREKGTIDKQHKNIYLKY